MDINWITFGSAIGGALTGGLLTGYFSIKSTDKAFEHQQQHTDDNDKKLILGLLQSIHDEIETVWDRYQETMGMQLESLPENEALQFYFPLVSDFFSVYNGNSFLIGRIPDNDLRKQIIKTYTLAKGIVDSFRMNNDLVQKFEIANKIFEETNKNVHKNHAIAHLNSLIVYAKTLKESHKILKHETASLLRELRKNGVLSENNN